MPLPTAPNPWKILSKETHFDTPWVSADMYQTLSPAGQPYEYGYIHFKNKAVGVVAYENGYVWLVGQTRFPLQAYSWEIIEGGCPEGEDPFDAATRELKEEAGITADIMVPLFDIHLSNASTDEWGRVYLATRLHFGESELEETEDISVLKISLDDLYAHVEAGEITDSLTVTATYKIMLMRALGELPDKSSDAA